MDLRDHHVQFRIRDIYLPNPASVLCELHGDDLLSGRVIEMSDTGQHKDAFVVVEVNRVTRHVVVPVDRVAIDD